MGRLKTIIKPTGDVLHYEYDTLGRVQRFFSSDFDYHYTYDIKDRVIEVYDSLSKTKTIRCYDSLGNIVQETLANNLTLLYTYDSLNRKTQCTFLKNFSIFYNYEGLYLKSISKENFQCFYTKRNLQGQIEEIQTPIGCIKNTYDSLGRLSSSLSSHFSSNNYIYDSLGNLLHYTYIDPLGEKEENYIYDDLNQLIQEEEHTYTYDSLFNRIKKDDYSYVTNTQCHTLQDADTCYSYDSSGNLISEKQKIYTYDSLDRLISVQEGDHKEIYTYDAFNRRLSKTSCLNNHPYETVRYLWEGQNEIGLVNNANTLLELRVLGEGLGAEIGSALLFELYGKKYIPLHDHRGCVVVLIDIEKKVPAATYRYSAFGEEKLEGVFCPWRFSSKRIDSELVYFGRRYYHPKLGKWITQDPKGFEDGPNLYAYVHNTPLTALDLYGLSTSYPCSILNYTPLSKEAIQSLIQESLGNYIGNSSLSLDNRIISLPGKKLPHHHVSYTNGMLTTLEEAIKQTSFISQTHGNIQVDLIYHKSSGFTKDIINAINSKTGTINDFNKLQSHYFIDKLNKDPQCSFTNITHSRGAIQIMNTGSLLTQQQRKRITVHALGPAMFIPRHYFNDAKNYVSILDPIPLIADPTGYAYSLKKKFYDTEFLQPSSHHPLKEHYLLNETYALVIDDLGSKFQEDHFHE